MASSIERCVVIFGKTGHGKSSFANVLFGFEEKDKIFNEVKSPTRVTLAPQAHTAKVRDVTLRVIDTPGLFDRENPETIHERWPDILEAISLGQPSIDAVIVIVDARQLYSGANVMDRIQDCIGQPICGRVIICFTKYLKSKKSREEIINEFNKHLTKGVLGCLWVFSDKEADEATQNETRKDILGCVHEIHKRGVAPIEKEQFSEYTKKYFKESIKSLTEEVSLDKLRDCNTINIELLEMFLTSKDSVKYMKKVINDHNKRISDERAEAKKIQQRAAKAEAAAKAQRARQQAAEAERARQQAAEAQAARRRAAEAERAAEAVAARRRSEESCVLL